MYRLRVLISVFCVLALCSGTALADKQMATKEYQLKPWSLKDLAPFNVYTADVFETEPNNTCPGEPLALLDVFHGAITAADEDWVCITCPAGDRITIGTDADGVMPTVDTVIELYADDCTTLLTSDDDGGPGTYSLISNFDAPYTGSYYVRIIGFSSLSTGSYVAIADCVPPPPVPTNPTCATAINIPNCMLFSDAGNTELATNDYTPSDLVSGDGCTDFYAQGGDVVYQLDMSGGEMIHVAYTNAADASVYIITDCADPQGSCVAGADNTLLGEEETLDFMVPAAGTYYLILDTFSMFTSGGAYSLTVDVDCSIPTEEMTWGGIKQQFRE